MTVQILISEIEALPKECLSEISNLFEIFKDAV